MAPLDEEWEARVEVVRSWACSRHGSVATAGAGNNRWSACTDSGQRLPGEHNVVLLLEQIFLAAF